MSSEQKQKVPLLQRMFSSGTSALITKSIVTPFDVVKTCLQVGSQTRCHAVGRVYLQRSQTVAGCSCFPFHSCVGAVQPDEERA